MLTFGPQIVIEEEFHDLADVDQVVVYGSWARRHNGETGREPADLNVMVIGSPERDAVCTPRPSAASNGWTWL